MMYKIFCDLIKRNYSFLITSHIMPDGDSIGSVLALTLALCRLGKSVVPVIKDDIPKKYAFLPGVNKIKKSVSNQYDVAICLDCGDEERPGFEEGLRKYYLKSLVNIDHHKSNTLFGDINIVDSNASSVGEILYFIIKDMLPIDEDIASCLYTSIITDTGSIRHSNTTPKCLRVLADLVEKGASPNFISQKVFEKRSINALKLLRNCLDTLKITDDKIASLYITRDMMEKCGANEEDTDGIINYARGIEGVEIGVLFREIDERQVKVGFRSNDYVDVCKIAEKFGGGGHIRASGCTLENDLEGSIKLILETLRESL